MALLLRHLLLTGAVVMLAQFSLVSPYIIGNERNSLWADNTKPQRIWTKPVALLATTITPEDTLSQSKELLVDSTQTSTEGEHFLPYRHSSICI